MEALQDVARRLGHPLEMDSLLDTALTHGVRHILKKGVGGILHNVKGDSDEAEKDDEGGDEEEGGDEREHARQSRGNSNAGRSKAGSRR